MLHSRRFKCTLAIGYVSQTLQIPYSSFLEWQVYRHQPDNKLYTSVDARHLWDKPERVIEYHMDGNYSTSRKSLNKRLASGRVLRLRPPTHWTQFALRSSAFVCVRLRSSAFVYVRLRVSVCVCMLLRASAYVRLRLLAFHRKV